MIEHELYRAEQTRAIDQYLIQQHGIAGYDLMQRAAAAAYAALRRRWPRARSVVVVCGAGNNAGDGWVLARLAQADGLLVTVYSLRDPAQLQGDAGRAASDFIAAGGDWNRFAAAEYRADGINAAGFNADVVVDALLGTGLSGPPREAFAQAIQTINHSDVPVLALDIPSGLNADTGVAFQPTVRAHHTVTFIVAKQGLYTGDAAAVVGRLELAPLVPDEGVEHGQMAAGALLSQAQAQAWLPRREPTAHKGQAGHVLVAGGGEGMPGAVLMAGHAALRCGAGMVSVLTHAGHATALVGHRPELMVHGWLDDHAWPAALQQRCNVAVLGPGLGQAAWSQALYERLIGTDLPLVVDADGLNLLATAHATASNSGHGDATGDKKARVSGSGRERRWILTPHPGEAGRLLACTTAIVQNDRIGAARQLAQRYQAVAVLKGAGTVVARPDGFFAICPVASGALASAGMGDVLSGVLGALLAQGMSPWHAACAGVWFHARAGLAAAGTRSRGVLAGDVIAQLPDALS